MREETTTEHWTDLGIWVIWSHWREHPWCRRFSTTLPAPYGLIIYYFYFLVVKWTDDFFSFLRWTIVPTARLTPTLVAQSGCFHPWIINIFHWSLIVLSSQPLLPVFPQETWLSYLHILNLLQISSFCQPSLDQEALYREREGEWNSLLEALGRTENYTLSVQHSAFWQTDDF